MNILEEFIQIIFKYMGKYTIINLKWVMGGKLPHPTRLNVVNDIFSILNKLIGKVWKVSLRRPVHDGFTPHPWLVYRNTSICDYRLQLDYK